MIELTNATRTARLQAIATRLDAGSQQPYIAIYGGTRPSVSGAATTEVMLAKLPITKPSLKTYTPRTITLNTPGVTYALANGVATWARMIAGDSVILADLDVGEGLDLTFEDYNFYIGGEVGLPSVILRE